MIERRARCGGQVPTEVALERLWDALAWLHTYDPGTVDDMEGEFGFSVHNRTVNAHNPRVLNVREGKLDD